MQSTLPKILLCGASAVAAELLPRMGDGWHITLVDPSSDKLNDFSRKFSSIAKIFPGDASSPVVLDEVGLEDFSYVLALSNKDPVNLAICEFAKKKGIVHVLALVNDSSSLDKFQELHVKTIPVNVIPAKSAYQYLKDPRIDVTTIGRGHGELMEVDISEHQWVVGKTISFFLGHKWRIVAMFRDNALMLPSPDTEIKAGDRLVILGSQDLYRPICTIMECEQPSFPLRYGQGLVMALPPKKSFDVGKLLDECLHMAQNSHVHHLLILAEPNSRNADLEKRLGGWMQTLNIEIRPLEGPLERILPPMCSSESIGMVALPPLEGSFLSSLTKAALISLAHSLPNPLLICKNTQPYKKLLVPFSGMPRTELALEIAFDISKQLQAEITVAVVQEPDFIHSEQNLNGEAWAETTMARARQLAHVHKISIHEELRMGNPVREIVELSQNHNLLILGSTKKEKALFSPHVGELLAGKSACSVLIVTG